MAVADENIIIFSVSVFIFSVFGFPFLFGGVNFCITLSMAKAEQAMEQKISRL